MSTIKHPVGPRSRAVYWRRRLVVACGLLAFIAVIWLIVAKPGAAEGENGPAPEPSSTSTSGDAAVSETTGSTGPRSDGDPCAPGQVRVEALTDSNSYASAEEPKLSLSLTNTGSTSCTMNAGTSQQVYTITSGTDLYWKSTDCQTEPADRDVLLPAGKTVKSEPITWHRVRSAKDTCDDKDRPAAPANGASYHLTTEVAGIESTTPKQFLLN